MQENWNERSLNELRAEAKARGIKGISAMRKNQLIQLLSAESPSVEMKAEPKAESEVKPAEESKTEPVRTQPAEKTNRREERTAPREERRMPRRDENRGQERREMRGEDRREMRGEDRRDNRRDSRRDDRRDDRRETRGEDRRDNRRDTRNDNRRDTRNDNRRNPMNNNAEAPVRRNPMNNNAEAPVRRNPMNNNVEIPVRRSISYSSYEPERVERPERMDRAERMERPENRDSVYMDGWNTGTRSDAMSAEEMWKLDSGITAHGILEVTADGYGFIRSENFLTGDNDVYVSHAQIRRFHMKTGDMITGNLRVKTGNEKNAALLYISEINGEHPSVAEHRKNFEDLTPIFPNERIHLEKAGGSLTMRIVDLMCPIGKGQRGMIVSPPKAGKTTLMKDIAAAVKSNHPEMHIIILLIDERPEEVTDIRESIEGDNVEVIYSTFDEMPEHHRQVSEMVLGRAKRLVEHGRDVIILLDSITRLTRAYNLSVTPSGRTLSGGLDPAALHMPKKFFGAARNMREGGSLTILATALVETGSRMDDVVFEEFKGTGNMEVVLDRRLSERRIFPAIDIQKSGTRRDDLLLTAEEKEAMDTIRRGLSGMKQDDAVEQVLNLFTRTKNNREFVDMAKKIRL